MTSGNERQDMNPKHELERFTPQVLSGDLELADTRIREGRFQRWLSLIAGLSSVLAGLEVSYEHYRAAVTATASCTRR